MEPKISKFDELVLLQSQKNDF